VGYVVDRDNWQHVYTGILRARDHGADNVRVAMSFTPERTARWQDHVTDVREQVRAAITDFQSATFAIHDLTGERAHNVALGRQEYPFCAWKEVGCVVGADQQVYACCSWAYNAMGKMFSIREQSFRAGWFGEGTQWRDRHDPRTDCRIHCLYEGRNVEAL